MLSSEAKKTNIATILYLYFSLGIILWPLVFRERTAEYHNIYLAITPFIIAIFYLLTKKIKKEFTKLAICGAGYTVLVASINLYSYIYLLSDILKIIMILSCIFLMQETAASNKAKKTTLLILVVFYATNIALSFFGSFYYETTDGRMKFLGLIENANLNSYTWLLSAIYISTTIKRSSKAIFTIFLWGSFFYIYHTSQTKSLFLAVPFLCALTLNTNYSIRNTWIAYACPIIMLLIIGQADILERAWIAITGLSSDDSFKTRLAIYQAFELEISKNLYVLPAGVGYSQAVLDRFSEKLPAHNDILKYYLDYGVIFALFLGFLLKKLIIKDNSILLLLFGVFVLSSALHNNLLSIFIIPLSAMTAQAVAIKSINKQSSTTNQ